MNKLNKIKRKRHKKGKKYKPYFNEQICSSFFFKRLQMSSVGTPWLIGETISFIREEADSSKAPA